MKKIYVISSDGTPIEKVRELLNVKDDTDIVVVRSREDIPAKAMLSPICDGMVHKIHKITARHCMDDAHIYANNYETRRKGHERPYKFHK